MRVDKEPWRSVDRRTTQNPSVRAWATRQRARKLMITITVLEVQIGVCRLEWRDPVQGPMLRLAGA